MFMGCRSFNVYNDYKITDISAPALNEVTTASVGDELIVQGKYETGLGVRVLKDCLDGKVKKGVYYATGVADYINSKNEKVGVIYRFDGEGITPETYRGVPADTWLEYNTFKKEFGCRDAVGLILDDIYDYTIEENAVRISDSSFQQTLIYLGKSGSVLKFGYRESIRDLARPAYSNEISYDLKDSDIVGYKKAKLQVIEATNTSITYKVLSYFDNSQSIY